MRCPHCGSFDDKVIESRTLANGEASAADECLGCGYRFTSYERIEENNPWSSNATDGGSPDRHKIEHGRAGTGKTSGFNHDDREHRQ